MHAQTVDTMQALLFPEGPGYEDRGPGNTFGPLQVLGLTIMCY